METFAESGLKPALLSALSILKYDKPTPIQVKALDHLMEGDIDLIGLAQTGTGKTAAFSLPLIHRTHLEIKKVQTLILCPTRELCLQICRDVESYTQDMRGFSALAVYGGASMTKQIKALKKGTHMVVGTPGRTLDLIKRGILKLNNIRWVVLDEADEMLSMGFKDDLDAILDATPEEKQTLLFSATMPKEISRIADKYMDNPVEITAGQRNISAANIDHGFYYSAPRDRYRTLKAIVDAHPDMYAIIFCRTRAETKDVAAQLGKDNYSADALHGDLSQSQRDYVMDRFRRKQLHFLVATDVAARGLDVNDLTHVINFNLPDELESYIHRCGRTGRAGKEGSAISIIHRREIRKIKILERKIGAPIQEQRIPTVTEIIGKRLFRGIDQLEHQPVEEDQVARYRDAVQKKLSWLTKEELIDRIISQEISTLVEFYKHLPKTKPVERSDRRDRTDRRDRRDRRDRQEDYADSSNFTRFYINLGSKHKVDAKDLLGILNEHMRGDSFDVGKIDILKSFSFFEVENSVAENVLKAFDGAQIHDHKLVVEKSKPQPEISLKKKHKKKSRKKRNSDHGFKRRSKGKKRHRSK